MESSIIERPIKIVCGEMAYDGKTKNIECPPETVKNVKMLPKFRVPIQEGELAIKVEESICEIDNGKIISLEAKKAERNGDIISFEAEKAKREEKQYEEAR